MHTKKPTNENTQTRTFPVKLEFASESDKQNLIAMLKLQREVFNYCSKQHWKSKQNSIVEIHKRCYHKAMKKFKCKSQIVIKSEQMVLGAYKTAKSNKHKLTEPPTKKHLGMMLDQRLYSFKDGKFRITTNSRRVVATPLLYPRVPDLSTAKLCDPTISVRGNNIYIAIIIEEKIKEVNPTLAIGVDLGVRRLAATSEGIIYTNKKYLKEKRKLRYLKRCLRKKIDQDNSRKAKQHLWEVSCKERNHSLNFVHNLTRRIIDDTQANVIVLEDLHTKKLKAKKHKYNNKNRVSQVAFSQTRTILTYKAALANKLVVCVNPAYTSQVDSVTGKHEGERKGCRFYSKSGLVYDADINAAVNIAHKTKLPVSQSRLLDGQAIVNSPYVKSSKINLPKCLTSYGL